jgi:heme/copper-type cytochrome/quinol oxidase subunit 3
MAGGSVRIVNSMNFPASKTIAGTINTAILLTSSLTMAMASQAAASEERLRNLILWCLAAMAAPWASPFWW